MNNDHLMGFVAGCLSLGLLVCAMLGVRYASDKQRRALPRREHMQINSLRYTDGGVTVRVADGRYYFISLPYAPK